MPKRLLEEYDPGSGNHTVRRFGLHEEEEDTTKETHSGNEMLHLCPAGGARRLAEILVKVNDGPNVKFLAKERGQRGRFEDVPVKNPIPVESLHRGTPKKPVMPVRIKFTGVHAGFDTLQVVARRERDGQVENVPITVLRFRKSKTQEATIPKTGWVENEFSQARKPGTAGRRAKDRPGRRGKGRR